MQEDVCAVVQIFLLIGEMGVPHLVGHRVRVHGHGPQADPLLPQIQRGSIFSIGQQQSFDCIQRLLTVAVGPPELRVGNGQFHADMVAAQIT